MRRDLSKWAEHGSETLSKYHRYDLSHSEVIEAMTKCEVNDRMAFAFNTLIYGIHVGIELGRRIERKRLKAQTR